MGFEAGLDDCPEWLDAPWWLDAVAEDAVAGDAVAEGDVLECPEMLAVHDDLGPMSVTETLLAVSLAGAGPEAIRLLAGLRGRSLTGDQQLSVVELWQPQLAWLTGAEQTAIVDLVGPEPDPADRQACLADGFAPLELAAALHASTGHAAGRIANARLLTSTLTATGDRLREGTLDPYRVWLITDTLVSLGEGPAGVAAAREVEAQVLPRAATLTGRQLRTALRKGCRAVDPDWGVRMFAKNRTTRRVGFDFRGQDGLVGMYAALPPVEALAMKETLDRAAGAPCPDPGDDRSADERRADALIASVLGAQPEDPTTPAAPQVVLQVLVPLPTLLGLREDTAELVGYGAIPAAMAREMAGDAHWQRWVHDEVSGHLLDQGKHSYRPNTALARLVTDRDRHCRFPGCTHPAASCDQDHTEPFNHAGAAECPAPNPPRCDPGRHPGGTTSAANLTSLCRRAHRAKTFGDYPTRQDPDGTLHWTTPLGRHYTTTPHDYRPDSDKTTDP